MFRLLFGFILKVQLQMVLMEQINMSHLNCVHSLNVLVIGKLDPMTLLDF